MEDLPLVSFHPPACNYSIKESYLCFGNIQMKVFKNENYD
jgi:hypothetical protein